MVLPYGLPPLPAPMAQSPKSHAGCSAPCRAYFQSSLSALCPVKPPSFHFSHTKHSVGIGACWHLMLATLFLHLWSRPPGILSHLFSFQLTYLKTRHKGLPGRVNFTSSPGSLYIHLLDSCQIWSEGFVAVSILGEGDHDSLRAVMLLWIMHLWMRSWALEFFRFGFEFQVFHLAMRQGKFLLLFET